MRCGSRILTITALCLAAAGCVPIRTESADGEVRYLSRDAFRDHAVSVFRLQNQLSGQVIESVEDQSLEAGVLQSLEDAEREMMLACRALNAGAAKRAAQQAYSLRERRAIVRAMPACEAATLRLQAALTKALSL